MSRASTKFFARELGFPEAPVALEDGSFLFVEMSPERGWIVRIAADGSRSVIAKTGRPNGLAMDREGSLWVAETAQRALLRLDMAGGSEVVAERCGAEPFLFLNDLAFAPNGDLYLTDSGIAIDEVVPGGELAPNYRQLRYDGRVYRIECHSRAVELLDRGLQFANGLAFGPDGALYVAETLSGNIYRYAPRGERFESRRELFGNVIEHFDPAELKGPDGMKFDALGNLYACVFGQGDVTVLDRQGRVVERLKIDGALPANLAFGRGEQRIYVTEAQTGTVQILEVAAMGLPLHG
ncbi:MAG TPA: SMP-30/gluconolactonase/LRE family protein [Steroidobacter sp.]|uniref:SMP-30/gluconolactonase/LRE family protein n=1 Tax=Steroidobacter sp. TaxID=1978227 RepID=UPI002ED916EA